jgi:heptosyltransferase-3
VFRGKTDLPAALRTRPPRTILVVVTRRIGDVLLATPLIRSLKSAWPGTAVDCLVFEGTQGVLAGNPDLRSILTVPLRPTRGQHLRLLLRIARRYDLALSALPSDRPTLYAALAGRCSAGLALAGPKHAWKRALLTRWTYLADRTDHAVASVLHLARLLGIEEQPAVVASWSKADEHALAAALPFATESARYAVLHLYPKFRYKQWTAQGWSELAAWLGAHGLTIVVTGGGAPDELAYAEGLVRAFPENTVNLCGKLSFSQVACLISRAALYVGPDTGTTHLAAATGTPTIALFGPSNPVRWGPWPAGYASIESPYALRGSRTVGNVTLLQGEKHCVPCLEEGCERHVASRSDCLEEMPAARVIEAAARALRSNPAQRANQRTGGDQRQQVHARAPDQ